MVRLQLKLAEALTSVAEGVAHALKPASSQSPPTSSHSQLNEMGVT